MHDVILIVLGLLLVRGKLALLGQNYKNYKSMPTTNHAIIPLFVHVYAQLKPEGKQTKKAKQLKKHICEHVGQ